MKIPDAVPQTPSGRRRPWVAAALLVGVTGATIAGLYLSIFPVRSYVGPVGWDSVQYAWRTTLSQEVGISESESPEALPPRSRGKKARPSFPAIAGAFTSVTGVSPLVATVVLPGVFAAAIGLAAAALAGRVTRGSPLVFGLLALGVAVSPHIVVMLGYAYFDNLVVAAVFLAAAVPTVASVETRGAVLPAVLLLGALGLIHVLFFGIVAGTAMLAAAFFLPASLRARRRGDDRLLDTPAGRLGQVALGGAGLAAAGNLTLISARPRPALEETEFIKKLANDLPRLLLPVTVPLASIGAFILGRRGEADARRPGPGRTLVVFLLAWVCVTALGFGVFLLSPVPVPVNRLLLFTLPIPILATVGLLLGVPRALRRAPRWVGNAAAAAGVGALAAVSLALWLRTDQQVDTFKIRDASWVAQYLDAAGVSDERPIVFIVNDEGGDPQLYVSFMRDLIFAGFPPKRIDDVYTYMGTPEDYLAQRPSHLAGHPKYDIVSKRLFERMKHTYELAPVAVITPAVNDEHYNRWARAHPETLVGTLVSVVRGPHPDTVPAFTNPEISRRPAELGLLAIAALLMLGTTGLGWSAALFRTWLTPREITALAPAIGAAALVVGAVIADRLGVEIAGTAGVLTALAVAVAGWAALALSTRRPLGKTS